jgi:hypothetical protein
MCCKLALASPLVLQMCDLHAHEVPFRPVGAGQCDKPWIFYLSVKSVIVDR